MKGCTLIVGVAVCVLLSISFDIVAGQGAHFRKTFFPEFKLDIVDSGNYFPHSSKARWYLHHNPFPPGGIAVSYNGRVIVHGMNWVRGSTFVNHTLTSFNPLNTGDTVTLAQWSWDTLQAEECVYLLQ
jgi:hypothetical protein